MRKPSNYAACTIKRRPHNQKQDGRSSPLTPSHRWPKLSDNGQYECVYLHAWETGSEAKAGVGKWIEFYNRKRPHSALGGKPPAVVYGIRKHETQPDQQAQRVA